MKFFSFFTKTPSHQRFQYRPRYYDPRKEELQRRIRMIEGATLHEQEEGSAETRIRGSLQAARRRSQTGNASVALVRLAILLSLVLIIMAYLTWGRDALYFAFIAVPLYLYFRLKR